MIDVSDSKLYSHYRSSHIDALLVSEAWCSSIPIFNVLKYLQRAGHKSSESQFSDMLKAVWYLVYETASEFMPVDHRRLLADGIVTDLRRAIEDYSYPTATDAKQDSSDSQSASNFPSDQVRDSLVGSVPFD
jgi:hypothetical protein